MVVERVNNDPTLPTAPAPANRQPMSMQLAPDYEPEFDSLRDLLLEIAPERSVEHLSQQGGPTARATASCDAGAALVAR